MVKKGRMAMRPYAGTKKINFNPADNSFPLNEVLMSLPTTNLDDRKFQDIVDQAKRLIPQYCPEWTDHNVSDPGVALIELFAWMTDMLLYRVNQVPDKMYVKFLEMIGVKLEPPQAATVPITFYLSQAQAVPLILPEASEVATVRTETSPAIIFSLEQALTITPPSIIGAFSRDATQGRDATWLVHELDQLELKGNSLRLFPMQPNPNDAFYLALETDHSNHVMALKLECETAGGAGIDPTNPPLAWEVWAGPVKQWTACEVEFDGTGGFNLSGEIILHLPAMQQRALQNISAFWLRVRLTNEQAGTLRYALSPEIENLKLEARGGTANARHAVTVVNEFLGVSDGTPGQRFKLLHTPILARDATRDYLIVESEGSESEAWLEVADFADSKRNDKHYTLDSLDGSLRLGATLPQPDGTVYTFGQIPIKGATLKFARYQYGGGVTGNVPKGAICVLKSSIPYVARIVNRQSAVGGRNPQNLEDAKTKAPQTLRTRTRAVSSDDYELLAEQVSGVSRAYCLAPGSQTTPKPGDPKPGQVALIVLPSTDSVAGSIPVEAMTLSAETRADVLAQLEGRKLVGTTLEVRGPQLIWVSIEGKLRVPEGFDDAMAASVQEQAEKALYRFLNPYVGGPKGHGWPFGRDLQQSELFALLQRIEHVEFVEELKVGVSEIGSNEPPRPIPSFLAVPRGALLCSNSHRIRVSSRQDVDA